MKKFSIIVLAMMGFAGGYAQETETDYVPMVREGVKWVYYTRSDPNRYHKLTRTEYYFEGNGQVNINRKKCWRKFSEDGGWLPTEPELVAYAEEHNKRVYVSFTDDQAKRMRVPYFLQFINNLNGYYDGKYYGTGRQCATDEVVVYDFNDYAAHLKNAPRMFDPATNMVKPFYGVYAQDVVTINGKRLKRYEIGLGNGFDVSQGMAETVISKMSLREFAASTITWPAYVIEGYGAMFNISVNDTYAFFLAPSAGSLGRYYETYFSHIEENGEIVYKSENYDRIQNEIKAWGPNGDGTGNENVAVEDLPVDTPADGSGPLYDLQGRVVTNPAPGIYVRNGQKVVVE